MVKKLFLTQFQNKPSYVPRKRTKEELIGEVSYKKSWKGGSSKNDYFSQTAIMKPRDLDAWEIDRAPMLPRRYNKDCFSK